jgi:ATP adenylyltransferase
MMLVPRLRESFGSISLNSLAFAGALLVRNQQEMDLLKADGPMTALRHVTPS